MQCPELYVPQTVYTWHSPYVLCRPIRLEKDYCAIALSTLRQYVIENEFLRKEERQADLLHLAENSSKIRFTYYFKKNDLTGVLIHLDRTHRAYLPVEAETTPDSDLIVGVYLDFRESFFDIKTYWPKNTYRRKDDKTIQKIFSSWQKKVLLDNEAKYKKTSA